MLYFAFANDRSGNETFLAKLKTERRNIESALQKAYTQGLCDTRIENDATIDDIFADFINPEYQHRIALFHYAGHASGEGWHVEQSDSLANEMAYAEGTARLLANLPNLQLVFLNGCNTEAQIQLMQQNGIKNIVATAVAINDDVAVEFATAFYRALGEGKTINECFEAAQNLAITKFGTDTRGTWKTPPKEAIAPNCPWIKAFSTPNWSLHNANLSEKPNLSVFMAYAEDDAPQADELHKSLKILKRQGLINTFGMYNTKDRAAGEEADKIFKSQLQNTKIILLLISTNFLTDDVCNEIEEIAMQRHNDKTAIVIPVWLKTTATDGFGFTKIQGLPFNGKFIDKWSNKDEALTEVTKGLKLTIEYFLKK